MKVLERKYEIGYKPRICTVDCTLFYIKKTDLEIYTRLKTLNRHKEKDRYVNSFQANWVLCVLDEDGKLPTEKIKRNLAKRIWRGYKLKGNIDDYQTNIMNIEVKLEHGRVNYEFDEFKD